MATIENKHTGEKLILHSQHTFGRDHNNISVIQESDVSRKHATIYWENNGWYIMDYSSNGTKINKAHIHHATKKLKKKDVIRFSNSKNAIWELTNSNGPCCYLKTVSLPLRFIELDKGTVVKGENQQGAIFRNNQNKWILDDGQTETILVNGQQHTINDEAYVFIDNECLNETQRNVDLTENAYFQLILSNDEENVSAKIRMNELSLDLGTRSYNHLLLYLARAKKRDLDAGIKEPSSGWVEIEEIYEALSKELLHELDEYYINNLIFRLRKYLINLPPYGYLFANIIERSKGKLRFGFPKFIIEKEQMFA